MAKIRIYTDKEIKIMREGGKKLALILQSLKRYIKPGIKTKEIQNQAQKLFEESGGTPSFKGYEGFPDPICISVNEEVVHAPGGERIFESGDVVGLDLGLFFKGFHTDMAETIGIVDISPRAKKLLRTTKNALDNAIKTIRPGVKISEIGREIENEARRGGFMPVNELTGHGIGKDLHEEPAIPNIYAKEEKTRLLSGMVLAIEPIFATGDGEIKQKIPSHKIVLKNGGIAAHFEHTVAIRKRGAEILTKK